MSYVPFSQDSYKLILAIIRRLRTAGTPQALTIPNVLRSVFSPDNRPSAPQTSEPVTLEFTVAERLIVAIVPTFLIGMPLTAWLIDAHSAGSVAAIPPALMYLVGLMIAGTYAIGADSCGVVKSFMFWRKKIAWSDVDGYEVHGSRHTVGMIKRLLIDRDGKTLIDITPDAGSKQDQQRLLAYVHARLAEVLPSDALNPPWKARPWTPP